MRSFIFALVFLLFLSIPCFCRTLPECATKGNHSYFWTLQQPGSNVTSHLFGLLRVYANLVPNAVPDPVKAEFARADVAVFESRNGQQELQQCVKELKRNEKQQLPRELAERLDKVVLRMSPHARQFLGLDVHSLSTEWLLFALLHFQAHGEMTLLGAQGRLIDNQMQVEVRNQGAQLDFVERLAELCPRYLTSPTVAEMHTVVEHLLGELEHIGSVDHVARTIQLYKCGLYERQDDILGRHADNRTLDEINAKLLADIVGVRNARWADRMERLLRQKPNASHFFALGASHFLGGEDSLVELMARRGFIVREVPLQELQELASDAALSPFEQPQTRNLALLIGGLCFAIVVLCVLACCCYACCCRRDDLDAKCMGARGDKICFIKHTQLPNADDAKGYEMKPLRALSPASAPLVDSEHFDEMQLHSQSAFSAHNAADECAKSAEASLLMSPKSSAPAKPANEYSELSERQNKERRLPELKEQPEPEEKMLPIDDVVAEELNMSDKKVQNTEMSQPMTNGNGEVEHTLSD